MVKSAALVPTSSREQRGTATLLPEPYVSNGTTCHSLMPFVVIPDSQGIAVGGSDSYLLRGRTVWFGENHPSILAAADVVTAESGQAQQRRVQENHPFFPIVCVVYTILCCFPDWDPLDPFTTIED